MEFEFTGNKIIFEKELSDLDRFVFKVVKAFDENEIKYVIVSGYVSILFGRSRSTEDIDVFIEKIDLEKFRKLISDTEKNGMWILNETDTYEAYKMLADGLAIRIAEKEKAIPNFEIKFPKKETDYMSLEKPLEVVLSGNRLLTSTMEMQIAYKLYLGSDKDIEDAVYIYRIFNKNIDKKILNEFIEKLNVKDVANENEIR